MAKKVIKTKSRLFPDNPDKWTLFIFLAVFVLYGNTLFNKYAMDDEFVIKNKQVQQGIRGIPEIFTTQYFQGKETSFGYRPVTKAVFAIEYEIFGENPWISHFVNVLLFAVTCVLLLKILVKILLPGTGTVFLSIALGFWICHPVHTEVVASLKNREEILYLLFCLLSLHYFIRFAGQMKWLYFPVALLFYILAFLTKQSAVAFAGIIPVALWFLYVKTETVGQMIKNNYKLILPMAVLFIVTYVLLKLPDWYFPPDKINLLSFENPLHTHYNRNARIAVSAYTMLINLKLLIFPHPLVFYYGQFVIPELKITDLSVIFSLLLHIAILVFVIRHLKNKPVLVFGILFYLVTVFPFSNYLIPMNGIVAERFLYAPSIGFVIILTWALFKITRTSVDTGLAVKWRKSFKYATLAIIIVYSVKTVARNTSWKDSLTLYSNDIHYLENSVKANDILAQEKMDRIMRGGQLKKSIHLLKPAFDSIVLLYERSLSLYPENPKALNNLANIYINVYKNPEQGLACLLKAYAYKKNSVEICYNLAQCYEALKKDSVAARYYNEVVSTDPKQYKAWHSLITLYFKADMPEKARSICDLMLKKDTLTDIPYVGLGYYFIMNKDTLNAVKNWEKAVARNPDNYERLVSLGKYFNLHQNQTKSEYYYKMALSAKGKYQNSK